MDSLIYRPGEVSQENVPLARYLPRLPRGTASNWLQEHIPPGSWVIDPFGACPQLAVEIAQAGYRLIVSANNPVNRFLLEMAANPPTYDQMQAALAELAAAKRGEERLQPHILSLYETLCDECDQPVSAEAFLWDSESNQPYVRQYTCPHCGNSGEFPVTPADLQKAARFAAPGPHRARALERVASAQDPNREHAEEALSVYRPRAVYALFTILNRLDSLNVRPEQRRLLEALILSACDGANTLWAVPAARQRPKQLTIPPRYREQNVWLALENAIEVWSGGARDVTLTTWPWVPPESGGICLYEGRIKSLGSELEDLEIKAVVSALPRPNQAFWTLSALWSGWLWGRQAVGAFAQVLARQRYDWSWHTRALTSALRRLSPELRPKTPFLGLITECEAGFDAAAMLSAEMGGFLLAGNALRRREGQSQYLWLCGERELKPGFKPLEQTVQQAGLDYLAQRGESSHYLHLQSAALAELLGEGSLAVRAGKPARVFNQVRVLLENSLSEVNGFRRYQGSEHDVEVGRWWLKDEKSVQEALADRVEKAVVNYLIVNPATGLAELDQAMCETFTGLMTPEVELLRCILHSYAQEDEGGNWRLRESDNGKTRRSDLEEMRKILTQIGKRLGYQVHDEEPLKWHDRESSELDYYFYLTASALLSQVLTTSPHPPERCLLVLPGGRAELVLYKLERDHRLAEAAGRGWRFLKFRQVRRMAENLQLNRQALDGQFELDPLRQNDPQMPLL
jgi:hypothetical protein